MKSQKRWGGGHIFVQERPFRKVDLWSEAWRKGGYEPHGHREQGVLGRGKSEHMKWRDSWMGPSLGLCSTQPWALPERQAALWWAPSWGIHGDQTDETREHHTVSLWGNWLKSRTGFSLIIYPLLLPPYAWTFLHMVCSAKNPVTFRGQLCKLCEVGAPTYFNSSSNALGLVTSWGSTKKGTLKILRAKFEGWFNLEFLTFLANQNCHVGFESYIRSYLRDWVSATGSRKALVWWWFALIYF